MKNVPKKTPLVKVPPSEPKANISQEKAPNPMSQATQRSPVVGPKDRAGGLKQARVACRGAPALGVRSCRPEGSTFSRRQGGADLGPGEGRPPIPPMPPPTPITCGALRKQQRRRGGTWRPDWKRAKLKGKEAETLAEQLAQRRVRQCARPGVVTRWWSGSVLK